jgi:acyl carrier protein
MLGGNRGSGDIRPEIKVVDDLHLDSIVYILLVVMVEEAFGIEIPDEKLSYDLYKSYGDMEDMSIVYAMETLRCCSIVAHVHDELIIEADRRMSLTAVCEQMGRTPPWAEGLLPRADWYEAEFYK